MKKSILTKLAAIAAAVALSLSFASCNEKGGASGSSKSYGKPAAETDFDIKLTKDESGIIINEYKANAKKIVIPDTIQGYPVVAIRRMRDTKAKTVVVPEGVKVIEELQFREAKVILPESLIAIGDIWAKEINLPSHLKYIGNLSASLENPKLPDSLKYIKSITTDATELVLPNSLVYLGGITDDELSLKKLTLPDNVEKIFTNIFYYEGYGYLNPGYCLKRTFPVVGGKTDGPDGACITGKTIGDELKSTIAFQQKYNDMQLTNEAQVRRVSTRGHYNYDYYYDINDPELNNLPLPIKYIYLGSL